MLVLLMLLLSLMLVLFDVVVVIDVGIIDAVDVIVIGIGVIDVVVFFCCCCSERVNLDVSSMLAWVSSLTHGGENCTFAVSLNLYSFILTPAHMHMYMYCI